MFLNNIYFLVIDYKIFNSITGALLMNQDQIKSHI